MDIPYEKGLELEKLVTELFKSKGYDARHNVKLTGRSGVEHQIDVYTEYKTPLYTSRIVIECKSYDKPINKDVVMKLVNEVEDLGVDRGILVTTSYFTPDAVSTAEGYNIELWDGVKLKEFFIEIPTKEISVPTNVFHVEPNITPETARELVDNKLKGIFGRKGTIESSSMVFYPYYEIAMDAKIAEKRGLLKKKVEDKIISSTALVDAFRVFLCNYDPKKGAVGLLSLPDLTEEEARVFRLLSPQKLTTSALASLLSCSTSKARRIIQGLVAKGVAESRQAGRQILYQPQVEIPELSLLMTISQNLKVETGEPKKGTKIGIASSLGEVENFVKLLWEGMIKDFKTIFYPYCACKIAENGKRYVKVADMITNELDERIGKIFTSIYDQLP